MAIAPPPTFRDFPRSEGYVARRRTVAACLWIAAPGVWITHHLMVRGRGPSLDPIELPALAVSSVVLLASAVALGWRPALARTTGMLALIGAAAGLGRRAPASPEIAFIAFAGVALLGFGLLSLSTSRARPPVRAEMVGALWSRAVLLSSLVSLVVAGAVLASEVDPGAVRPLIAAQLGAAGLVASAGERALAAAERIPVRRLLLTLSATLIGAAAGALADAGLLLLVARLVYAISWAAQERQRGDVVGIARSKPGLVVFGSFGLAIFVGAMMLSLPAASPRAGGIDFVDALFTATSAVCVTGLSVIDVGRDLTFLGQIILLGLIQAGGLGIMTLSAMIVLALGRSLSGREETVTAESAGTSATPGSVLRMIKTIAIGTASLEGLGAVLLFALTYDEFDGLGQAAWYAIFHAVSAFCNAGFGLDSTSLERFAERPLVLQLVATLVILGGLGFGVLYAVVDLIAASLRRRPRRRPLSLHTKVVLTTSGVLLLAGTVLYLALEWNGVLGRLSVVDKISNAFFQSTMLRTAGFNAIRNTDLGPPTVIVTILLMVIGGSPGSTAGGIKTTTAAVLYLAVRNVFSSRDDVEAFGRRIDPIIVNRAVAITALYSATAASGIFLLLLTQNARFDVLVFEVFSAVSTVGASMGATGALDDPGKVVLILLMFLGRVGPLTAASLLSHGAASEYRLPRGEVNVG